MHWLHNHCFEIVLWIAMKSFNSFGSVHKSFILLMAQYDQHKGKVKKEKFSFSSYIVLLMADLSELLGKILVDCYIRIFLMLISNLTQSIFINF